MFSAHLLHHSNQINRWSITTPPGNSQVFRSLDPANLTISFWGQGNPPPPSFSHSRPSDTNIRITIPGNEAVMPADPWDVWTSRRRWWRNETEIWGFLLLFKLHQRYPYMPSRWWLKKQPFFEKNIDMRLAALKWWQFHLPQTGGKHRKYIDWNHYPGEGRNLRKSISNGY